MNSQQTRLVEFLTETNQSLINQVRAKDLAALSGLQQFTGGEQDNSQGYVSTEDREMEAYYESLKEGRFAGVGDEINDDDLETFRNGL